VGNGRQADSDSRPRLLAGLRPPETETEPFRAGDTFRLTLSGKGAPTGEVRMANVR